MSLRTPLGRVLGLGSSGGGTGHWWSQRVTAVALALLGIWFVFALLSLDLSSRADVSGWLSRPLNAVLMVILLGVAAYHSLLGTEVVVEDYTRGSARVLGRVALQFAHVVVAGVGIFAVLKLAFGG
jgi:succinate dehydrogenase / fumarate reductase membrane anchor subunit